MSEMLTKSGKVKVGKFNFPTFGFSTLVSDSKSCEARRLLKNPKKRAAFDAAFKKGMAAMLRGGPIYWPPYQK